MKMVSDEVFNELKREAMKIWKAYDDQFGYATEKISYLNSFGNVQDNYGTIIGMFDGDNQRKLYAAVGDEAREAIKFWIGGPVADTFLFDQEFPAEFRAPDVFDGERE